MRTYETNLSTQETQTIEEPRLHGTDEHQSRPQRAPTPPVKGTRPRIRLMLKAANRLRAQGDFARAYQGGKTRHGEFVMVRARANHKPVNRYGIVVSKKVSKRAVARNRIKRRIMAIVRTELPLSASSGADLIIVVRPNAPTSSHNALQQDIIRVVQQSLQQI